MPEVTCPACRTRRGIDADATGYTCSSCGATWDFVTCSSCGGRFHAAPDAAEWRCPTCGVQNARAHAGRPFTVGISDLPIGPNRMLILGVVGILVLALATWALTRDGDDGAAPAPTPTATATPSAGSAREALCAHLVDIQSLRFEALGTTASVLRDDADAIEAEGDARLARQVRRLSREVAALQAAFDTPEIEDDQSANEALLAALAPIPCG